MGNKQLTCETLSIHTTTVCTLKCAKCGGSFPAFNAHVVANIDKTIIGLDKVFKIFEKIHEVRLAGAEAFLYPDLEKLMCALIPYQNSFEYVSIATNGTYIPKQSILDNIRQLPYPFMVRIDNYGPVSTKHDELIGVLKENNINVDDRTYTGKDQAFGGWIYYGDYTDKHYTEEQLKDVFRHCRMPGAGMNLWDDRLTNCCYSLSGQMLEKIQVPDCEVVDLSGGQNIEEMKRKVSAWQEQPYEACKYCNGFDPINSPRYPAAEQLT